MRRVTLFLVILLFVITCAVPSGTAFAFGEATTPEALPGGSAASMEQTGTGSSNAAKQGEPAVTDASLGASPDSEKMAVDDADEVPQPEQDDTETTSYPPIVISEVQVDGDCGGSDWCIGGNIEFIELYNPNDMAVSLEGWKLQRQATSETSQPTDHVVFGDIGLFAGEYAVVALGLKEPAESILTTFTSTLNNNDGSLLLVAPDGTLADIVGWGTESKRFQGSPAEAPRENQSIQRCVKDGILFEAVPRNNALEMLVYEDLGPTPGAGVECAEPPVVNGCDGLAISEIAANTSEQFIELYNATSQPLMTAGCRVQTNRNAQAFVFPDDSELAADEYAVISVADTDLTLTKTTAGTVSVLSSDGQAEVDSVPYNGLSKETSWALIDNEWLQTYAMTPGALNIYERYPPCETGYERNVETGRCNKIVAPTVLADCGEGRERNPETGRCRTIPTLRELAPCREGQYRSEETNRCRSIAATAARVLKPCADDQFRNPATNRCKKIASAEDIALADCGEGRERNPETNRCRNVLGASSLGDTLPFPVEETPEGVEQFAGWWTFGTLAALGAGYGIWEWRAELLDMGRKAGRFVAGKK